MAIMLVMTLARFFLLTMWWSRVQDQDALSLVMMQVLRFDLVILGILLILPLLLLPFLATSALLLPLWKPLLALYLTAILAVVLFLALATRAFAAQFDVRPNVLFLEYIRYPLEIGSTLWGAYRDQLIVGVVIVAVFAWTGWNRLAGHARRRTAPVAADGSASGAAAVTGLCHGDSLDTRSSPGESIDGREDHRCTG